MPHDIALSLILVAAAAMMPPADGVLSARATGTFDVVVKPLPSDDNADDGTSGRLSLSKQFHGDLAGTSKGQMLGAQTGVEGSAAYVAIERISGTLNGRTGTFVLQHSGTMSKKAGMQLRIAVVPDSGTGQLTGLAGEMTITITGKLHSYEFAYTLPKQQ